MGRRRVGEGPRLIGFTGWMEDIIWEIACFFSIAEKGIDEAITLCTGSLKRILNVYIFSRLEIGSSQQLQRNNQISEPLKKIPSQKSKRLKPANLKIHLPSRRN